MKESTFAGIVVAIMVTLGVIEILFVPWQVRIGVSIGMLIVLTLSITYRKFVKK